MALREPAAATRRAQPERVPADLERVPAHRRVPVPQRRHAARELAASCRIPGRVLRDPRTTGRLPRSLQDRAAGPLAYVPAVDAYETGVAVLIESVSVQAQGEDREENLMHGAMINDQRAPSMVDSSTYAAPLWLDFMQEAVYDYPHESLGSARKAPVVKKKEPAEDSTEDSKSDSKEDSKSDSKKESSSESKSDEKESKKKSKSESKESKSDSEKESKSDD